jgi:hypothetical protein
VTRRDFITLLSGAAAAWPLAAPAQQPAVPTVGFFSTASAAPFAHLMAGLRRGLQETCFVEGRNIAIEYRWAEGQYDRVPALAADLARRQVTVIVTVGGETSAVAAMAATTRTRRSRGSKLGTVPDFSPSVSGNGIQSAALSNRAWGETKSGSPSCQRRGNTDIALRTV